MQHIVIGELFFLRNGKQQVEIFINDLAIFPLIHSKAISLNFHCAVVEFIEKIHESSSSHSDKSTFLLLWWWWCKRICENFRSLCLKMEWSLPHHNKKAEKVPLSGFCCCCILSLLPTRGYTSICEGYISVHTNNLDNDSRTAPLWRHLYPSRFLLSFLYFSLSLEWKSSCDAKGVSLSMLFQIIILKLNFDVLITSHLLVNLSSLMTYFPSSFTLIVITFLHSHKNLVCDDLKNVFFFFNNK